MNVPTYRGYNNCSSVTHLSEPSVASLLLSELMSSRITSQFLQWEWEAKELWELQASSIGSHSSCGSGGSVEPEEGGVAGVTLLI